MAERDETLDRQHHGGSSLTAAWAAMVMVRCCERSYIYRVEPPQVFMLTDCPVPSASPRESTACGLHCNGAQSLGALGRAWP